MRGVVLCEESGVVSAAFSSVGVECWSCDLAETRGDPRWHIVGDALEVGARRGWDFAVMHPPCTHTAVSGARHFSVKRADGRQQAALAFIRLLWRLPIRFKALEQPVSIAGVSIGRRADQVIQPWQFGHGETKATCLWLDGFPRLLPTVVVGCREARVHRMAPGPNRQRERSATFPGIASAMADQWGGFLRGDTLDLLPRMALAS